MINKLIITVLLLSFSHLNTENDWELIKKKEGIEIYTRAVTGSSFKEFKGITTIHDINLAEVLAVIIDIKNYSKLFPNVESTRILQNEGMNYFLYYMTVSAPWPLKNRDSVYEQKITTDQNGKHAKVIMNPKADYLPVNKDMVRIRKGNGFWELFDDGKNNVQDVYQFQSEPQQHTTAQPRTTHGGHH